MSGTRERWVYRTGDNGECIKFRVDPDAPSEVLSGVLISMDRHLENTCATDGTDIGSRRKRDEYLRRNGLTHADDYKQTWTKAAEERAKFFTEGGGERERAARREAVGRAAYELEKGRRR